MSHDWHDSSTARRWDSNSSRTNPTRSEQLDVLVSVLAALWRPGAWLLDLGFGSGQVEQRIFERIPEARVVGVDSSEAMMAIARARLVDYGDRFTSVRHDLAALEGAPLPDRRYQFAIAVQSLHHLAEPEMRAAYRFVHGRLDPGGVFLLLDRLKVEDEATWPLLRAVWERQDRVFGVPAAAHEGRDFADHQRTVRGRGDYPVLLDQHLLWLREAGFTPACLHLHGHRGLIAAAKAG